MEPLETRLQSLEQTSTAMQVTLARIDERLDGHVRAAATANDAAVTAIRSVASQLEMMNDRVTPLQERSWKQAGATTVLGLVGGFFASLAVAAVRMWK